MKKAMFITVLVFAFASIMAQTYHEDSYTLSRYDDDDFRTFKYISIAGLLLIIVGAFIMSVVALPSKDDKIFVDIVPDHLELFNRKRIKIGGTIFLIGFFILLIVISKIFNQY